jgi:hypothetical protein
LDGRVADIRTSVVVIMMQGDTPPAGRFQPLSLRGCFQRVGLNEVLDCAVLIVVAALEYGLGVGLVRQRAIVFDERSLIDDCAVRSPFLIKLSAWFP